jgi:regulator of protease activity HflC (stomatin/prohibitin superfamily)
MSIDHEINGQVQASVGAPIRTAPALLSIGVACLAMLFSSLTFPEEETAAVELQPGAQRCAAATTNELDLVAPNTPTRTD